MKGCAKLIEFEKNVNMNGSGYDNNKSSKWNGRELLNKEVGKKGGDEPIVTQSSYW